MAKEFIFKGEYLTEATHAIAKYPDGKEQSAVLTLLDLAQRQRHDEGHYVNDAVIDTIATMLHMPRIRVMEVASFFTMINLQPVGQFHIQLCGTTPCMLRGAEDIRHAIENHLNVSNGGTTDDNMFTLTEVECLGACCNAPMVQINDDYYEDLTPDSIINILDLLRQNGAAKVGSQIGRMCSEPFGGPQVLKDYIENDNA